MTTPTCLMFLPLFTISPDQSTDTLILQCHPSDAIKAVFAMLKDEIEIRIDFYIACIPHVVICISCRSSCHSLALGDPNYGTPLKNKQTRFSHLCLQRSVDIVPDIACVTYLEAYNSRSASGMRHKVKTRTQSRWVGLWWSGIGLKLFSPLSGGQTVPDLYCPGVGPGRGKRIAGWHGHQSLVGRGYGVFLACDEMRLRDDVNSPRWSRERSHGPIFTNCEEAILPVSGMLQYSWLILLAIVILDFLLQNFRRQIITDIGMMFYILHLKVCGTGVFFAALKVVEIQHSSVVPHVIVGEVTQTKGVQHAGNTFTTCPQAKFFCINVRHVSRQVLDRIEERVLGETKAKVDGRGAKQMINDDNDKSDRENNTNKDTRAERVRTGSGQKQWLWGSGESRN
ncbi:hypothetical protein JB92DRAFT_3097180 [Gautieria morchelliformis]|nr:hypothetical protein JB92DRAFT_3097180 [Gautieria morchelliformis]